MIHNDWLLVPRNQDAVGLHTKDRQVLSKFDRVKEIDEIRMVGVMRGLIRIRDYINRVSVQFYSNPFASRKLIDLTVAVLSEVTTDPNPYLTIQNLFDDSVARLELTKLKRLLAAGEKLLEPVEPIKYNEELRQRMAKLLN